MTDYDRAMLQDFLDEAGAYLETLNDNLLLLESTKDDESAKGELVDILNRMFRAAHSLKGMSGMLEFTGINQLTHKMENVLDPLRAEKLALTSEIVDVLFGCFDLLSVLVDGVSQNHAEDEKIDTSEMVGALVQILENSKIGEGTANTELITTLDLSESVKSRISEEEEMELFVAEHSGRPVYEVSLTFGRDLKIVGSELSITQVFHALEDIGEIPVALNVDSEGENAIGNLVLICDMDISEIQQKIGLPDLNIRDLRPDFVSSSESGSTNSESAIHITSASAESAEEVEFDETPSTPIERDKYFDIFVSNTHEAIDQMQSILLEMWPKQEDEKIFEEAVNAMFRETHNIKSEAAAVGLDQTSKLAHHMESIFSNVRSGAREIKEELVELMLLSVDAIRDSIAGVLQEEGGEGEAGATAALIKLSHFTKPTAETSTEEEKVPVSDSKKVEKSEPPAVKIAAAISKGAEKAKSTSGSDGDQTIRVDLGKLDALINLTGELVIAKAGLLRGLEQVKGSAVRQDTISNLEKIVGSLSQRNNPELNGAINELHTVISYLGENLVTGDGWSELEYATNMVGKLTNSLQNAVLETRMIPVGTLFRRFTRVVRDLAKVQSKQVLLQISGEETEIDKKVIDELVNPMTHLIRNSVDHAIEDPEEREAKGKSPTGTVNLNAYQEGQSICIEIRDDGGGLNLRRIKEKALENGIFSEDKLNQLSPNEINQLIFHPGFSTAAEVTDISGRGVGMDVVKRAIENLNGTIDIETNPETGSSFVLRLPLTLAIIPAFLFKRKNAVYCLPLSAADEVINSNQHTVSSFDGRPVIRLREAVIPVVSLEESIGMEKSDEVAAEVTEKIVIVNDGKQRFGIGIDEALGKEEVVIKSLSKNLGDVPGISGATILGNGRVALILDAAALAKNLKRSMSQAENIAH